MKKKNTCLRCQIPLLNLFWDTNIYPGNMCLGDFLWVHGRAWYPSCHLNSPFPKGTPQKLLLAVQKLQKSRNGPSKQMGNLLYTLNFFKCSDFYHVWTTKYNSLELKNSHPFFFLKSKLPLLKFLLNPKIWWTECTVAIINILAFLLNIPCLDSRRAWKTCQLHMWKQRTAKLTSAENS